MSAHDEQFIVGEASKSWLDGKAVQNTGLLSEHFAAMINHNHDRGYVLRSWQIHRMMVSVNQMNETVVAVFERSTGVADRERSRRGK